MDDYLPLVFTFALAVIFILGSIVTTKFVAPRRPTAAKAAPYESGIDAGSWLSAKANSDVPLRRTLR